MERDGLATRRRLPPPGAAYVYELTSRMELLPCAQALGAWGQAELGERRPTDAVRAHWFALPLLRLLDGEGLVEVRLEEGQFHLRAGAEEGPVYGDGPAPGEPDARLVLDTGTCTALSRGAEPGPGRAGGPGRGERRGHARQGAPRGMREGPTRAF
ncbi:hypothetical protein SAFG77S_03482 [Streptomyces afghaniensis]